MNAPDTLEGIKANGPTLNVPIYSWYDDDGEWYGEYAVLHSGRWMGIRSLEHRGPTVFLIVAGASVRPLSEWQPELWNQYAKSNYAAVHGVEAAIERGKEACAIAALFPAPAQAVLPTTP